MILVQDSQTQYFTLETQNGKPTFVSSTQPLIQYRLIDNVVYELKHYIKFKPSVWDSISEENMASSIAHWLIASEKGKWISEHTQSIVIYPFIEPRSCIQYIHISGYIKPEDFTFYTLKFST